MTTQEGTVSTTQPIPSGLELALKFAEMARTHKRAEAANRRAAQVAAQTHDMLLAFCAATGVTVEIQFTGNGDTNNDE